MKIYGSVASPFVQRVLIAARLKGHEIPVELPAGGNLKSPDFLAISPMGRVPVLEHDGWTLAESSAIAAYLDETLDGPRLLPADARARGRVRTIESLVMCELAGMRPVMVGCVFGMPHPEEVVSAGFDQVGCGLAAIEQSRGAADTFAIGDTPTLADCALLPFLLLMEIADPKAGTMAMVDKHPGLSAYLERARSHPILGRTTIEMPEAFKAVMARRAAARP